MLIGTVNDATFIRNQRNDIDLSAQLSRPGYEKSTQAVTYQVNNLASHQSTHQNTNSKMVNAKISSSVNHNVITMTTGSTNKPLRTLEDLIIKPLEVVWSLDYDIEKIHELILSYLKSKKERKEVLTKTLKQFKVQSSSHFNNQLSSQSKCESINAEEIVSLKSKISKVTAEIETLEKISTLEYMVKCSALVKEYITLSKSAPIILGQKIRERNSDLSKKTEIVKTYLELAKIFYPINITREIKSNGLCPICNSLVIDNGEKYVCSGCNSLQSKVETAPEYTNTEDHTGKYNMVTDKSNTNYQDIVLQIQAKFPIVIPPRVYETLTNVFATYKNFNRAKLSRSDLYKIMKEQGLSTWYKHLNKIHMDLTSKKAVDLSRYEENLFRRGELLNQIYNGIKSTDRSNFIHGLYLVWLFLMNEGYQPDMEDFLLLKGRQSEIDNIVTLEKGFEILRGTHPEFSWRIFQLP